MKTLKEDAEEYYNNNIFCDGITEFEHDIAIRCYIAGAKEQAEKMYSAEKPKQELPYWFETQGWEDFNKLVENNFVSKPTQEILEEAAEKLYQKGLQDDLGLSFHDGIKLGAKWQAEKMYSEEEVIRILDKREDYLGTEPSIFDYLTNEEWFQLFKIK